MELASWRQLLDRERQREAQGALQAWFHLYRILLGDASTVAEVAPVLEQFVQARARGGVPVGVGCVPGSKGHPIRSARGEAAPVSSLIPTARPFLLQSCPPAQTAPQGQFSARLNLLAAFRRQLEAMAAAAGAQEQGAAVLVSYSFNDNWKLGARFVYENSTGRGFATAPNIIGFGAGSNAYTFTITPTYQYKLAFIRAEFSYVTLNNATVGSMFGTNFNQGNQARVMLETGLTF